VFFVEKGFFVTGEHRKSRFSRGLLDNSAADLKTNAQVKPSSSNG